MPELDRTFEAVVFSWEATAAHHRKASATAVRRRVEELCRWCVDVAVVSPLALADVDPRLSARPAGPGRLFLALGGGTELYRVDAQGPHLLWHRDTGSPGPLPWLLQELAGRGVGPGLTVLIGDLGPVPPGVRQLPDGSATVLALLDEQVRRRRERRVPAIDEDPEWVLSIGATDRRSARSLEALLSLGDGVIGLRGSHEEPDPLEAPLLLAAGVYTGEGPGQHLLPGPWPLQLRLQAEADSSRRVLDLRTGVLVREAAVEGGSVRTLRLVAAHRHGVVGLRAEGPARHLAPGPLLSPGSDGVTTSGARNSERWARTAGGYGGIGAVASQLTRTHAGRRTVERLAVYATDPLRPPATSRSHLLRESLAPGGFEELLLGHRRAWSERWDDACVWIPDDPQSQFAVRFALFHLWCNVSQRGEAGVGARGLTGGGYAGHVFWDADVFVLPAMAALSARAARAMLEYRVRRLPQARTNARLRGLDGARFPWESGLDGYDVTPTSGRASGEWVPILTGQLEEHVVADIAWAACHYAGWTGDHAFLEGPGRDLVLEGARYWASRAATESDQRAHLRHVIGPDEYHELVDDNAYTNLLARWHLRRAAELTPSPEEAASWRQLADALVDGYDPRTHRHEQFEGYDKLEPLLMADVGPPPLAADLLLGASRTAASQLVKQPDVLMAHYLLGDQMPAGSLAADLDFYLPRTAHGSSLSPAIVAALLARAGRPDEAVDLLDIALRLDLDDLTGMTGSGLHLATLGGVWQALLRGFAGACMDDGALSLDPHLPTRWGSLRLRFRCRGRRVQLDLTSSTTVVTVNGPLLVRTPACAPVRVAHVVRLVHTDTGWMVQP